MFQGVEYDVLVFGSVFQGVECDYLVFGSLFQGVECDVLVFGSLFQGVECDVLVFGSLCFRVLSVMICCLDTFLLLQSQYKFQEVLLRAQAGNKFDGSVHECLTLP